MDIDIFGSCITRDAFEFDNSNHRVKSYFARSSLLSLIYPPIKMNLNKVNWPNNFVKRTVKDDLEKRFVLYSINPLSKVIIVDLIQERYPISYLHNSYYTYSSYHNKAKIPKGSFVIGDDHLKLFNENINEISSLLKNYDLVILHEANLTKTYVKNDKLNYFDLTTKDQYFIKYGNEYYKSLKKKLDNVYSIKLEGFLGASEHKWGLSPSHYEDSYYEKLNEGIDYIIRNKKDFYFKKRSKIEE